MLKTTASARSHKLSSVEPVLYSDCNVIEQLIENWNWKKKKEK